MQIFVFLPLYEKNWEHITFLLIHIFVHSMVELNQLATYSSYYRRRRPTSASCFDARHFLFLSVKCLRVFFFNSQSLAL